MGLAMVITGKAMGNWDQPGSTWPWAPGSKARGQLPAAALPVLQPGSPVVGPPWDVAWSTRSLDEKPRFNIGLKRRFEGLTI